MAITCSNCGNSQNPPGAQSCAVCGVLLPMAPRPVHRPARLPAGAPAGGGPAMFISSQGRRYIISPNPVAAYLTLDWLIKEPDAAQASLARGHDWIE